MVERQLTIVYDCPLEIELEDELKRIAKKFGWILYVATTDNNERDISFYKTNREEGCD